MGRVNAPEGALICQPRATPGGERMQHGYAPEGGKRMTAHHYRVAKGVSGIIILLPILGECWLRTIPKALPWADLFLAFLSPLCFESEQARAQAVYPNRLHFPPFGRGWEGVSCSFVLLSDMKGGGHVLLSFCQICSNAPLENTLQRTENALKSCNHLIHNVLTPFPLM